MTEIINNDITNKKMILLETISVLYDSNIQDAYLTNKIENHILQLPTILESLKINREKNQQKTQEKITDQDKFIQSFLNKYSYFYNSTTDRFFYYDGIHYKPYAEEDILHNIFLEVSKERHLHTWKQKTKISTLKRIKDQYLLKTIPNSETIQIIIDMLYPVFFSSKTQAKYFLTILGDTIFKKTPGLVYFITPHAKNFLREIDTYSQLFIGCHPSTQFKYKYHEHDYSACRFININESIKIESIFYPFLNNHILDILCVSAHYSNRFGNADEFLRTYSNDDELMNYAFYLKDRTPIELMRLFCDEYIIRNESESHVNCSWRTIQYLWKHFLESKSLPNVLFQQELLDYFSENYSYDSVSKSISGIFSKFMPGIERFIRFWDETMVIIPTTDFTEYEIDEIIVLFKKWGAKDGFTERHILDLIVHFFPIVETDGQKFVFNVKSKLWDKETDLRKKIDSLHIDISEPCISIYKTYDLYRKNSKQGEIIVNKSYFEKFVLENLREYIVENQISLDYWKNNR